MAPPEVSAATPITAIYLLNDPDTPVAELDIKPISAAAACMSLVAQGFRLDLGSNLRTATFLQQAAAVTRTVPAYELCYPRDFRQTDIVITTITRHLQSLQPQSQR